MCHHRTPQQKLPGDPEETGGQHPGEGKCWESHPGSTEQEWELCALGRADGLLVILETCNNVGG